MASRSLKRAASHDRDTPYKKSRLESVEENFASQNPELSNTLSVSSTVEDDEIESDLPTPQTTLSSKGSPAYPSNLKTIPCTFPGCEKTFNRPAKLAQHLHSHTNTRPFLCPNDGCTKDFLRSSHLQHHIKSAHSDTRDYVCDHECCGKGFITRTRLRKHRVTHDEKQKFVCTVSGCGQQFRKHNTLQRHIVSIHEGRRPFVCQKPNEEGKPCGAGFDRASNLKIHEGLVHSGKTWSCTLCISQMAPNTDEPADHDGQRSFPSKEALKAHIRDEHSPVCQECGLEFEKSTELAKHIEIHHGILSLEERRKYPCLEPGCGRSFTQKSNLMTHTKDFHLESKAFVCGNVDPKTLTRIGDWGGADACGRVLSSKGNLITHIRTVHLGLEPSRKNARRQKTAKVKSAANEGTSSSMDLLTGTGYKSRRSHQCHVDDCDYRFQNAYDLQRHMENYHGVGESEMQITPAEPGRSVIRRRFDGFHYLASAAEDAADRSLNRNFDNENGYEDYFDELEESAAVGGPFWLGGEGTNDTITPGLFDWDLTGLEDPSVYASSDAGLCESATKEVEMIDAELG